MKPHRITLQDIGPFTDLVDVDLDALARGIVCLAGNNGTGKTIFLESILAGVTRKLPSYGDLADMATSKDAYLQVEFTTRGRRWKARHEVGRGAVYLYNDRCKALDDKGKVGPFEEWVAENVIPLDVATSSWVRTQESRGFVGMLRGERKSIVLRAKGSEEVQRLAERARKRTKALERDLVEKSRMVDGERSRCATVEDAQALKDRCATQAEETASAATRADQALAHAREVRTLAQAAADKAREEQGAYQKATERAEAARKRLRAAEARLVEVDDLLANAEAVELSEKDMAEATTERGQCAAALLAAQAADRAAEERQASARKEAATATKQIRDLEALRVELVTSAKQRQDVEHAAARATQVETRIATNQKRLDALREEIDATRDSAAKTSDGRITALRGALTDVESVKTIASARKVARAGLDADDGARIGGGSLRMEALQEEARLLTAALGDDMPLLASLQRRAEFLTTVEKAERGIAKLDVEIRDVRASLDTAGKEVADVTKRRDTHIAEARAIHERICALDVQIRQLTPLVAQRKQLDQADAIRAEVTAQIEQRKDDLRLAEAELAGLHVPTAAPEVPSLVDLEAAARIAQRAAREAADALVRADEALRASTLSAERLATLRAEESAIGEEAGDTSTLAEALGPSGVQALLVDAAGPELTDTMNRLLSVATGPRFSVQVETTRPDARGKREIEEFLINVTDTEKKQTREARLHCGGERVFLNEAVAIALASMSGRSYGIDGGTLFRDETTAAFQDENVSLWMMMLRAGLAQYGLDRAIIVAHHQEAKDLADQVIEVSGGSLQVVR